MAVCIGRDDAVNVHSTWEEIQWVCMREQIDLYTFKGVISNRCRTVRNKIIARLEQSAKAYHQYRIVAHGVQSSSNYVTSLPWERNQN